MPIPTTPSGRSAKNEDSPESDFSLPDLSDDYDEEPEQAPPKRQPIRTAIPSRPIEPKRLPKEPLTPTSGNPYDSDDDPFSNVPAGEAGSYDEEEDDEDYDFDEGFEEPEPVPAPRPKPQPRKKPRPQPSIERLKELEDDDDEDFEEDEDEKPSKVRSKLKSKGKAKAEELPPGYTADTFIDAKEGKLKPFGRVKRKAKVSEFDDRKNLRQKAKIVQTVVIGLIVIVLLIGLKNTLFPTKGLNQDDVEALIVSNSSDTGFPIKAGESFAEDFVSAYLTVNSADPLANEILGYYYTGTISAAGSTNRNVSSTNITQKLLSSVRTYSVVPINDSSASFVVGALVKTTDAEDAPAADAPGANPKVESKPRWMFFNVNVYYNVKTLQLSVDPASPTLVPAPAVASSSDLPDAAPIGSGRSDEKLNEKVRSVVYGFVKAYAISSAENHSALDQYIILNPPAELLTGLNKEYGLSGDDSYDISYTAFPVEGSTEVKVDVKVRWLHQLSDKNTVEYSSFYIMTLQNDGSGKYLVSRFAPRYFVAK